MGLRYGFRANGSSPRVRGTPDALHALVAEDRFIPACAGNARTARSTSSPAAGSSPRVRGTPGEIFALQATQRFIPACAGNA